MEHPMIFYGKSDVGKVRTSNQDGFLFHDYGDGRSFAVVCDGMGGHNGGNIASEMAVEEIRAYLTDQTNLETFGGDFRALVLAAIRKANDKIFVRAVKEPTLKGMGTTVVLSFFDGDHVLTAHVGDSRAYQFRDGELRQLTTDHSLVQEMISSGQITDQEAQTSPYRHVITRAVGTGPDAEIDFDSSEITEGTLLILCSDGLSNAVPVMDMEQILKTNPVEKVCDVLVDTANKNGGNDNITVVVAGKE